MANLTIWFVTNYKPSLELRMIFKTIKVLYFGLFRKLLYRCIVDAGSKFGKPIQPLRSEWFLTTVTSVH